MSRGMSAEKRARRTRMLGTQCLHASHTSKPIASPSRSQSSQRIRSEQPRTHAVRFFFTSSFWSRT